MFFLHAACIHPYVFSPSHLGLFSALNAAQINSLVMALEPREFHPGQVVQKAGEPMEYYIINKGSCSVFDDALPDPYSPTKAVRVLHPGDGFGESSLFPSRFNLSPNTVIADTQVHAYRLHRRAYRRVLVAAAVSEEARTLELLGRVPLLEGLFRSFFLSFLSFYLFFPT
jgi:CRP-like cAMP-binding protein